jgi:hypothetical protein
LVNEVPSAVHPHSLVGLRHIGQIIEHNGGDVGRTNFDCKVQYFGEQLQEVHQEGLQVFEVVSG